MEEMEAVAAVISTVMDNRHVRGVLYKGAVWTVAGLIRVGDVLGRRRH